MTTPIVNIHTHFTPCDSLTLSSWGIHPWHAAEQIVSFEGINIDDFDAIGEIGLDFCCSTPRAIQQKVFEEQLLMAQKYNKIVVIHCVRAYNEVLATLKKYSLRCVIFHGFIGSTELMQRIVGSGYYVSYGERTFSSSKAIEAMSVTPLNRLFVETDTSDISIREIYSRISTLRGVELATFEENIYENYKKILNK